MDDLLQLKIALEKGRQSVLDKSRTCLFSSCDKKAIGSHVLQQNAILKNIVDQSNHFYAITLISLFQMKPGNAFEIRKVGINEGYKFPGFCVQHDNDIFKPVETHPIDFGNERNLALFTYRTICLELRKKEIYFEQAKNRLEVYQQIQPDKKHFADLEPAELAIKDLQFYKSELETELNSNAGEKFEYSVLELPEKKICFSSPLTIDDSENELTFEYDKYGNRRTKPLAISVLNYFPYNSKSFLVAAKHRKYHCRWTDELIQKFRSESNIDKMLSDLLTYRLEFWGISPEIYEKLSTQKIKEFISESHEHWDNYAYKIETDFNLFT